MVLAGVVEVADSDFLGRPRFLGAGTPGDGDGVEEGDGEGEGDTLLGMEVAGDVVVKGIEEILERERSEIVDEVAELPVN